MTERSDIFIEVEKKIKEAVVRPNISSKFGEDNGERGKSSAPAEIEENIEQEKEGLAHSQDGDGGAKGDADDTIAKGKMFMVLLDHNVAEKHATKIIKALHSDGVAPKKELSTLKAVAYCKEYYKNTADVIKKFEDTLPLVAKLVQTALSSLSSGSNTTSLERSQEIKKAEKRKKAAAEFKDSIDQINQFKALKKLIDPLMDEASKKREEVAKLVAKEREELVEKVQIQFESLNLSLPKKGDLDAYQNALQNQLDASEGIKLTDSDDDFLLRNNRLMHGLVMSGQSIKLANGVIGKIVPGKSPFHHPTGMTYTFEQKEVRHTKQYANMVRARDEVGSSAANAYSVDGGAITLAGGGAFSLGVKNKSAENDLTDDVNTDKDTEVTKFYTQEAKTVTRLFQLADADYDLSPEFENELVKCVVKEDEPNGKLNAQIAANVLLAEFGSAFATQAKLGGSYILEQTMSITENSKDEIDNYTLRK